MYGCAWLRSLVAGFSPLKTEFEPGPMQVGGGWTGWLWDRSVFERVHFFLRSVSIVPPLLHIALHLSTNIARRTSGRSLGISSIAVYFSWKKRAVFYQFNDYTYTPTNKNPSVWSFLSPELEVTWRTVAIIIRVVLLAPSNFRGARLASYLLLVRYESTRPFRPYCRLAQSRQSW